MTAIPISLDDTQFARVAAMAERAGLLPEEFLRRRIEAMLDQPDDVFLEAVDQVLRKNAELYRRLA